MARVTRSTKIVIAEDETSQSAPQNEVIPSAGARAPLEEISNITEEIVSLEDAQIADEEKLLKAAFKSAIGIKKKNKKSKNRRKVNQEQNQSDEVIPDDQPVPLSPAVDAVRQLLQSDPGTISYTRDRSPASHLTPPEPDAMAVDAPNPTTTTTVRLTRSQMKGLLPTVEQNQAYTYTRPPLPDYIDMDGDITMAEATRGSALHIENIEHSNGKDTTPEPKSPHDDSFIEHIVERSPAKAVSRRRSIDELVTLRSVGKHSPRIGDSVSDLIDFEDAIIRSPAKPVSRIEDSVEELDKMEDVIEALTEAARAQELASPVKTRKVATTVQKATRKPAASPAPKATIVKAKTVGSREGKSVMNEMVAKKMASGTSTIRSKPIATKKSISPSIPARPASAEPKPSASGKRPPVKRPISLLPPKEPTKSTKPPTRPTFELPGEAIGRKLKEQREARIAQRNSSISSDTTPPILAAKAMAPKVKSTKVPTRPTFELPGEALSRKKREALEVRLKAQEEEEKKRREFKAKPHRKSIVPSVQPRQTTTSLARRSTVNPNESEDTNQTLLVSKRHSVIGSHRPSLTAQRLANTSAPRTRVSSQASSYQMSITTSESSQRQVSGSTAPVQKLNGRDIYKRDSRALEGAERERKEKEAAAKKAREEAAERGRQASREWAEKQRRKMMESKSANEGQSAGEVPVRSNA